jgi:arylsulfatase A-like enzyme
MRGIRERWGRCAVVAAFIASLALAAHGGAGARGSRQAAKPPNIVLIVSDDQTYETAKFMKFISRPDWTKFTRGFISTPLCCPSRATILTGQYAMHTGVTGNRDGSRLRDTKTLATWLSPKYRTGFFGKYLNGYPWHRDRRYVPPGWDEWLAFHRAPHYYDYKLVTRQGRRIHYGRRKRDYSTTVLDHRVAQFVRRSAGGRKPFFAYYAPYGPHKPRTPAPGDKGPVRYPPLRPNFNERNVNDKPRWVRQLDPPKAERMRELRRREQKTLRSVDRSVRHIVRVLARRRVLNNTVLIYLSDNGYSYGSHRFLHKDCAYEECIHVPFQMWLPGRSPRQIGTPVSNVDLAPTIADLAGVQPDIPQDGRSLLPIVRRGRPRNRSILLRMVEPHNPKRLSPGWGVRTRRFMYDRLGNGDKELYDLRKDPFELRNRIQSRRYRHVRAKLTRELRRLRR